MNRLIGSEVTKLRTTRTFYGVTIGALGLVVVISLIASLAGSFGPGDTAPGADLMGIAGIVQLFTLVLGILAVSTEYRHGTITPSLLVVPDRARLVLAKLAAHFVAGLMIGVLAYGLCALLVLPILNARDVDTMLEGSALVKIIIGGSMACALFAALGVGLGALVRNQVGAIVGSLAYVFVIEPLVGIIPGVDDIVAKWGLGGLSDSLAAGTSNDADADLFGQVPAGLIFAGYVAIFLVAGIYLMRRRDVTS
jgi:ABC-2 type transport system permease protein